MKWIKTTKKLPEFNKKVLVWGRLGHELDYEIAILRDMNGDRGYTEWVSGTGHIGRMPNKKFPDNLKWNIGGHWLKFDMVTHWAKLIAEPNMELFEKILNRSIKNAGKQIEGFGKDGNIGLHFKLRKDIYQELLDDIKTEIKELKL